MKWIKRILFLVTLFFGLYFFGNFRINDTNVRDYLQQKIPPGKLVYYQNQLIEKLFSAFHTVNDTLSKGAKSSTSSASHINPKDYNKALDYLSGNDQKKLNNMLEKHLKQLGMDAKKKKFDLENQAKQLKK